MEKLRISPAVKLSAISYKYYQHGKWELKKGDLYTIVRADDEVYEVVDLTETDVHIMTRTNHQDRPSVFAREGFQTELFGPMRVYIPIWLHDELKATQGESDAKV